MRNAEALIEGARSGGRLGYKRAADAALAFPLSFRAAYFFYRRFGIRRFLADRLGERFETLLVTRLIIQDLSGGAAKRSRSIFGDRAVALVDHMLEARLQATKAALDALRRQYVDYAAALEARFLRQSALRREMGRYQALFEGGLISAEVYRDLVSTVENVQRAEAPPRFDIGLDKRDLICRLELFKSLDARHLEAVQKLLRPRFTVPNELIVRRGERGDAVYFIASGAAEVVFPKHRIPLGSGDVFGELSLLTGEPRQADVRALTYCRLLVLRKTDFDRFMRDNRDVRLKIHQIAQERAALNRDRPGGGGVGRAALGLEAHAKFTLTSLGALRKPSHRVAVRAGFHPREIIHELLRRRHRLADERPKRPQDQPLVAVVPGQEQRPVSGREAVWRRRIEDIDPLQEMELRRRQWRNRRVLACSFLRLFEAPAAWALRGDGRRRETGERQQRGGFQHGGNLISTSASDRSWIVLRAGEPLAIPVVSGRKRGARNPQEKLPVAERVPAPHKDLLGGRAWASHAALLCVSAVRNTLARSPRLTRRAARMSAAPRVENVARKRHVSSNTYTAYICGSPTNGIQVSGRLARRRMRRSAKCGRL